MSRLCQYQNSFSITFSLEGIVFVELLDFEVKNKIKSDITASVLESTKKLLHLVELKNTPMIILGKRSIANIYVNVIVIVSQALSALPFALFALDVLQLLTRVNNPVYAVIFVSHR